MLCVVTKKDPSKGKRKDRILKAPQFHYQFCWSSFYGANEGSNSVIGVDVVLFFSHSRFYMLKLTFGGGINSQSKLLTLWGLLKFANMIHV